MNSNRRLLSSAQKTAPSLSPETIRVVKATAPVIAQYGYQITTTMYGRMLTENPSVKEIFNPSHQVVLPGEKHARQPLTLAQSIQAYAENIDNLAVLGPAVERIAQKHVSLYVLPEHYAIVKENLMWAIVQVLKDAVTPEIAKAWSEAYDFLAHILIERERTLRENSAKAAGGWEGYREFEIVEKKTESADVVSFHLKPKDNKPALVYEAGSYIAVQIDTPAGRTVRNYTLSSAPGKNIYRISVKKQPAAAAGLPEGTISSMLHNMSVGQTLKLGVPCGEYNLKNNDNSKPIVFINGGIGITPTVSMLEYMADKKVTTDITLLYSCRDEKHAAMLNELREYTKGLSNVHIHAIYDESTTSFPDAKTLMKKFEQYIPNKNANYYFCGPAHFMEKVKSGLDEWKVPETQIHFEYFGPTGNLQSA